VYVPEAAGREIVRDVSRVLVAKGRPGVSWSEMNPPNFVKFDQAGAIVRHMYLSKQTNVEFQCLIAVLLPALAVRPDPLNPDADDDEPFLLEGDDDGSEDDK
jgi:hypothetical protein